MIRLGGENTIAVVEKPRKGECHRILDEGKEKWGLKKITKPADQHGTYSFYFADLDENWCSWMFTQGRDLAAWGAGQGDAVNPNQFKPRGRAVKP